MEIRHVKGQLSKAKKAIATAVHKSNIPSGTVKFLRNVQMFCGPSPRNSLLSLQSETFHASSSASELSTHTSVPRNFDVLEQPRRRSESPHSIHEVLHSPDSHYARNHHGGARVLRVSNPDLHASSLSSSSSEEEEKDEHSTATEDQPISTDDDNTTPEQSSWHSHDDDSDTEDCPSKFPLHSSSPQELSTPSNPPTEGKPTAPAPAPFKPLSWSNSLQRASSFVEIIGELDDDIPSPVPLKDPRTSLYPLLTDFDLNPSLQGPGSRFPPFTRDAAVIAPSSQGQNTHTEERGRVCNRKSVPSNSALPTSDRAAHIVQVHAQRTTAISQAITARKLAVEHPDPLRSSPPGEFFSKPESQGVDTARLPLSAEVPREKRHSGCGRRGGKRGKEGMAFRPALSPKREDQELHFGGEVEVEGEEGVPRRYPTTLLSGPALVVRKEGKKGEEVSAERSVCPLCELLALEEARPSLPVSLIHELPALQPLSPVHELPASSTDVDEEDGAPRRHPTTLLSGPGLVVRKGVKEGLLWEEGVAERPVSRLCELPALEKGIAERWVSPLHELLALQLLSPFHQPFPQAQPVSPVHELPALEEVSPSLPVSPLHELPASLLVFPTHQLLPLFPTPAKTSGPSELKPDFNPSTRDEELVELPGDFSCQVELEGHHGLVELPGDSAFSIKLQTETAETADEVLEGWKTLLGTWDLGTPFEEKFEKELLVECES